MMQFSLAHNMFMHCTSFFSSFLCLILLLCFSVSLLLSLGFIHMAPKRSIPSKNLIRRRDSSSSSYSFAPSLPDSVRFHDEKARDDFFKNFSNRAIHLERKVILSNFLDIPLPSAFISRGWASLCEIPKKCPIVLIQDFYSNMHAIDTSVPRFTTVFRGAYIIVTSEFIFEVLHVPRVDCPNYPNHRHLSSIS